MDKKAALIKVLKGFAEEVYKDIPIDKMMFVLFMLCSSIFAFAQETDDAS